MIMNNETIISTQTRNTLLASAVSALICGLFLVDHLIFLYPSAPFGILYAIANFQRKWQIGLYTIFSSIIYIGAVHIFFRTVGNDLEATLLGGFLAGAFGAFTLALMTKFMSKTALAFVDEVRTTIVGGITGIVFVQLILFNYNQAFSHDENSMRLGMSVAVAVL